MTKNIIVEGMTCGHCKANVEKVLNAIPNVSATVDLEQKAARVTLTGAVADDVLVRAIEDAGYQVLRIN